MTGNKLELRQSMRRTLRELLTLLSDSSQQIDYADRMGDKLAFDEMHCMWFDDTYAGDNDSFKEMYDSEELAALKLFNDYFDSIRDLIPNDNIRELNINSHWIKLRPTAKETLTKLKTS